MSKFIDWLRSKPAPVPTPQAELPKAELPQGEIHHESNEEILRSLAVELAREDVGQRETNGPNRSPFIDAMAVKAGVPKGTPWCALWVSNRVYDRLCKLQALKNPLGLTASSQEIADLVPRKYWRTTAKRGDAFVMTKRNDPGHGHTGMVETGQTSDKWYDTIEGNTNKLGSRDGDGVYRHRRSTSGDLTKRHRCFVDVIRYIMDENGLP